MRIISLGLVVFGLATLLFSSARAATEGASLMTYSSEGPDCYADGTPVLDGEYYALVWQTEAAGDIAFTLAGEPADSSVAVLLRAVPRAKDGRLPSTTFVVDSSELPTLSGVGKLRLYLLDTRVYAAGQATVGGLGSVQAAVPVTAVTAVETKASEAKVAKLGFSASLLPEDVPAPRITGISVADGEVVLTVADTVDGINYTAVDPFTGERLADAQPATGVTGGEVKVVVPKAAAGSGFFKVGRR